MSTEIRSQNLKPKGQQRPTDITFLAASRTAMCHLSLMNTSAMLGTIYAELPVTLSEVIFFCRGCSPLSHTLTYAYIHTPTGKEPTHQSVTPSSCSVFCKFRHAVRFLCSSMSYNNCL